MYYFKIFLRNIPNIESLAKVSEKKLLKLWQGLGYYSRAKNLHKTSKILINNYKSKRKINETNINNLYVFWISIR